MGNKQSLKHKAITIASISVLMCSCATKNRVEYIDREVVRYDNKIQHDTLINVVHDSVYHTVFQKGDTIYDTKYIEKTKCRDRIVVKTDTCYRDSIQIQTNETTVEKQIIPKWCYICLVVCFLFIIFAIYKIVRWLH